MNRSFLRSPRVLLVSGVIFMSGLSFGSAQASDPESLEKLKKTGSCANCDLAEADLSGIQLVKADLTGANLSSAKLYKATLTEANLTYALLTNADLTGANLRGAIGADLSLATTTDRTTCPDGSAGPCK